MPCVRERNTEAGKQRAEDGGGARKRFGAQGENLQPLMRLREEEVKLAVAEGGKETSYPAGPSSSDYRLHYRLGYQLVSQFLL